LVETLRIGIPPIEIFLRRNPRAKRLTLRVSRVDRRATLTLPPRTGLRTATKFAEKQESWLRVQLAALPPRNRIETGATIRFRGDPLCVKTVAAKSVRIVGTVIEAGTPDPDRRLRAFLKTEARNAILPLVEHYSSRVARPFGRVTLRDTRSRWGSCSADGNLMFSWRLIQAPPAVLEYVVVHEVAHLVEMNHSTAFWSLVETLMPSFRTHRAWLRANGPALHAPDFGS